MNNTTVDTEAMLEKLNDEKAVLMIPAFVYLGILMVSGIIGNILVCYYYGYKSTQSSNTVFIVGVAMYDLILCTVSIPIEIVDIRFFYNFPYTVPCKIMRFVTYFAAVGSVFTLLVIAIDRYRKICRPLKKQLHVRGAKIACGMSVLFSAAFSWPAAVFYTSVPVDVFTDDGMKLQGFDCTTTRKTSYKLYLWIFNGVYLLCFLVSVIILFTMYGLVGRAIQKHNKTQTKLTRPKFYPSTSTSTAIKDSVKCGRKQYGTNETEDFHSTEGDLKYLPNKPKGHNNVTTKTVKFTTVMFVITVVFVLSFLPHLALSLWRAFQAKYEGESLSGAALVAFNIGLRSYFLNSAINPFTYGFFNSKFRAFFYIKFCPCCKRYFHRHAVSSSSGTTVQYQMHSMTSH